MTLTDAELDQLLDDIGLTAAGEPTEPDGIAHGSERGAREHRARGERVCPACHQAERDGYNRRRYGQTGYLTEEEWQARQVDRQSGGDKS
ncbi:hypothetical protein [Streptomyces sp. NPDC094468]|uniref:hypothetical protein n=1 Tax=Streptomyces sp. NPDC094468 TaxID=3366066 RepID=UPI003823E275